MYEEAKKAYEKFGVDTEQAIKKCAGIPVSIHCWQGDDVVGFEKGAGALSGGIQTTGNYPGKARNPDELMNDLGFAFDLIPGKKRVNLHAIYAVSSSPVERDKIEGKHFDPWIEWAAKHGAGLDFNPTLFSHPMAADGMTLASPDKKVREFWIRHCKAGRAVAEYIGKKQGSPCLNNIWIPDGLKDTPADRYGPRRHLLESLDEIYSVKYEGKYVADSVESKFFGIGLESYTVGSHEFYIAYAAKRGVLPLIDTGHFHPSEPVADKLSSLVLFFDKVALHVTRHINWDSDHVPRLDDDLCDVAKEIILCGPEKFLIGLDYFDASINRVAAWVLGARNFQKAMLQALLLPAEKMKALQDSYSFTRLFAMQEEMKTLPLGDVWQEYCARQNVEGADWLDKVEQYEKDVLSSRK